MALLVNKCKNRLLLNVSGAWGLQRWNLRPWSQPAGYAVLSISLELKRKSGEIRMMELLQPQKRTSAERVTGFFRERWVLLPILALAALVRFYDMTGPAIWYDEAASVLMSEFSLPLIWSHTTYDVHPPLYYLDRKSVV